MLNNRKYKVWNTTTFTGKKKILMNYEAYNGCNALASSQIRLKKMVFLQRFFSFNLFFEYGVYLV